MEDRASPDHRDAAIRAAMSDAAILAAIAQDAFTASYEGSRRDEYVRVLRSYVADFGGTLDEQPGRLVATIDGREVAVSWR